LHRQISLVARAALPGLLATLLVTPPTDHASAADDCVAAPSSNAPQGRHWYYRVDRAKGRKCWYLSADGGKTEDIKAEDVKVDRAAVAAPAGIPGLLSTLLGAPPAAPPAGQASAADDCVAAPNSDAPQGRRWYYHVDRAKHRECWYLAAGGEKVDRAAAMTRARDEVTTPTVRNDHPPARAGAPPAASSSSECDTERSVLNYRKIIAALFPTDSTIHDVDAKAAEISAKGCSNPRAGHEPD